MVVTIVVVDDGSSDGTKNVALASGADEVVRHAGRRGLARAFQTGLDHCLASGADWIVNIDADGQYRGEDIPALLMPLVTGQSDIVIGDRQVRTVEHFSARKRAMQRFGSWVVQQAAGIKIADAVSGFRAYTREAALHIFVSAKFSYTVETLIQAGKHGLVIASVPITTNLTTRPSRLHNGSIDFVVRQALILIRTYATYEPLRTFGVASLPFGIVASILLGRLIFIATFSGEIIGHIQSLVTGLVSLMIAVLLFAIGVIGDRILEQRLLIEAVLAHTRQVVLKSK